MAARTAVGEGIERSMIILLNGPLSIRVKQVAILVANLSQFLG